MKRLHMKSILVLVIVLVSVFALASCKPEVKEKPPIKYEAGDAITDIVKALDKTIVRVGGASDLISVDVNAYANVGAKKFDMDLKSNVDLSKGADNATNKLLFEVNAEGKNVFGAYYDGKKDSGDILFSYEDDGKAVNKKMEGFDLNAAMYGVNGLETANFMDLNAEKGSYQSFIAMAKLADFKGLAKSDVKMIGTVISMAPMLFKSASNDNGVITMELADVGGLLTTLNILSSLEENSMVSKALSFVNSTIISEIPEIDKFDLSCDIPQFAVTVVIKTDDQGINGLKVKVELPKQDWYPTAADKTAGTHKIEIKKTTIDLGVDFTITSPTNAASFTAITMPDFNSFEKFSPLNVDASTDFTLMGREFTAVAVTNINPFDVLHGRLDAPKAIIQIKEGDVIVYELAVEDGVAYAMTNLGTAEPVYQQLDFNTTLDCIIAGINDAIKEADETKAAYEAMTDDEKAIEDAKNPLIGKANFVYDSLNIKKIVDALKAVKEIGWEGDDDIKAIFDFANDDVQEILAIAGVSKCEYTLDAYGELVTLAKAATWTDKTTENVTLLEAKGAIYQLVTTIDADTEEAWVNPTTGEQDPENKIKDKTDDHFKNAFFGATTIVRTSTGYTATVNFQKMKKTKLPDDISEKLATLVGTSAEVVVTVTDVTVVDEVTGAVYGDKKGSADYTITATMKAESKNTEPAAKILNAKVHLDYTVVEKEITKDGKKVDEIQSIVANASVYIDFAIKFPKTEIEVVNIYGVTVNQYAEVSFNYTKGADVPTVITAEYGSHTGFDNQYAKTGNKIEAEFTYAKKAEGFDLGNAKVTYKNTNMLSSDEYETGKYNLNIDGIAIYKNNVPVGYLATNLKTMPTMLTETTTEAITLVGVSNTKVSWGDDYKVVYSERDNSKYVNVIADKATTFEAFFKIVKVTKDGKVVLNKDGTEKTEMGDCTVKTIVSTLIPAGLFAANDFLGLNLYYLMAK